MATLFYDPATEPVPTVVAGSPPLDQTALVTQLQNQVADLLSLNAALHAKIAAAQAALA